MNSSLQSIGMIFAPPQVNIPCQVCGKQSNYKCFNCQRSSYCSKQHQKQHWRSIHKDQCQRKKDNYALKKQQLNKHILQARKNYYENYSNKIFNHCLLDAKLMTGLSKQLLQLEKTNIKHQLQYGSSVCLLVRTFKILGDDSSARHEMDIYLKNHRKFLFQTDRYKDMLDTKSLLRDQQKQQLQMKLNLISGIANLCYIIDMNTTQYYVLYTKYVITCFGEDSFEASNCYFLVGCYFSEEGWFNKAIACFQKSAKIRGQFAGDCMFNIGILHKLMNNLPKALQTLGIALKLRQQQYGQDSNEVAEVNQLRGSIYTQLNDYKTALAEYQKAFRARCINTISPEYQNILELIHELYDKLQHEKTRNIYSFKQEIQGESAYWQNEKYQKKRKQDEQGGGQKQLGEKLEKYKKKKVQATQEQKKFSWKDSGLLNITQKFISTLNLSELFRLSELQLQLENCQSVFNLVYIVGTSTFFQSLRQQKKSELQKQNQKLFELMRMEDIRKMKHKDK